jgi:hypothetical protein
MECNKSNIFIVMSGPTECNPDGGNSDNKNPHHELLSRVSHKDEVIRNPTRRIRHSNCGRQTKQFSSLPLAPLR